MSGKEDELSKRSMPDDVCIALQKLERGIRRVSKA